jgi:hypothetical protein
MSDFTPPHSDVMISSAPEEHRTNLLQENHNAREEFRVKKKGNRPNPESQVGKLKAKLQAQNEAHANKAGVKHKG